MRFLLILILTITASAKPNIVFIIADDCTFRDLGCYGGQAHTPNIDKLAGQGMRFTRCFQTAPMCSPTRHNIYTGIPPVVSGAYPNHTFVAPETKSVVQYLSKLGKVLYKNLPPAAGLRGAQKSESMNAQPGMVERATVITISD